MTQETLISYFDLTNFILAVSSIVLAVVAIALSIVFFIWSYRRTNEAKQSANKIEGVVDRLEILFDKLHTESFGMLKDTFSDMRRYVWASDETKKQKETEAEKEQKNIQNETVKNVRESLKRMNIDENNINEIEHLIIPILEQAMIKSRKTETEKNLEILKEGIINFIDSEDKLNMGIGMGLIRTAFFRDFGLDMILIAIKALLTEEKIKIKKGRVFLPTKNQTY